MSYPGLASYVNAHLWKTIYCPTLIYGLDCLDVDNKGLNRLESTQGSIIKSALSLRKRSHHSQVLKALDTPTIKDIITHRNISLIHGIFQFESSPAKERYVFQLTEYILKRKLCPGTIVDHLVTQGISPIEAATTKIRRQRTDTSQDGHSVAIVHNGIVYIGYWLGTGILYCARNSS